MVLYKRKTTYMQFMLVFMVKKKNPQKNQNTREKQNQKINTKTIYILACISMVTKENQSYQQYNFFQI